MMKKSNSYGRNMTRFTTTQSTKSSSKPTPVLAQSTFITTNSMFAMKIPSSQQLTKTISKKAHTGPTQTRTKAVSTISSVSARSAKRVFVKFIFEGKQRKRILQQSDLSLRTLLQTAAEMVKTQKKGKNQSSQNSEKVEIYLDQDFSEKLDHQSFEVMLQKCEMNGKLVLQKFYIKKVAQSEESREEAEKKVLEVFELLMKQDIVKVFLKKKKALLEGRSGKVNRRSDIGGRVYEEDVVSGLMECLLTLKD